MIVLLLIIGLGGGFLLQTVLGFWQIKNFNTHYYAMRQEGKVAIGRSRGLLRTGVVLLLQVDDKATIQRAKKMQGVTIFARFKSVPALEGEHLFKMDTQKEKKLDRFSKKALQDARHVYRVIQAGGEVPKQKSLLEKVSSIFIKKREVKH